MQIQPSLSEFVKMARRATVVPVWGELLADLHTPVSALLQLDDGRESFLLESVAGEEKLARFSFLGTQPGLIFTSRGRAIELIERRGSGAARVRRYEAEDPLTEIQTLMRRFRTVPVPGLPRFTGGLVGYLGYRTVRYLERIPAHRADPLRAPEIMLMLAKTMVIFDHAQHTLRILANGLTEGRRPKQVYRECVAEIRAIATRLASGPRRRTRAAASDNHREPSIRSNLSRAEFVEMVKRAKADIRAGEIIQVVLSQRFERPIHSDPRDVYRVLRSLNPSPYMYFLRFGSLCLVGSSPEMLVRCEDGLIEARPIAGTRRRGSDAQDDARLIQQLLRSPKERAEHLMLVDLGRNDLGRVAKVGSVQTPELMAIEKYSHVMHLVSGVTAQLQPGKTAFDVLRASFPAGTVTGAPKVRAMQIIAELERDDRGPYAGAVGYFSFSGNLDTCITIRTILIQGRRASVQAGAGIVADSDPNREYDETVSKAKGCLEAIRLAEAGQCLG